MAEVFAFCPNGLVPETLAREPITAMSMNGWSFTAKPNTPYQRKFKITLHGLRWFLDEETGMYDFTTSPEINAHALEKFYQMHETWLPFEWTHPHIGLLTVRFAQMLSVPAAIPNSGGLCEPLELQLIHHNPGFV